MHSQTKLGQSMRMRWSGGGVETGLGGDIMVPGLVIYMVGWRCLMILFRG